MNGRKMPSPALVIAVLALFVSLSGTAVAAGVVPLAKRALTADNSKKLGGQTADSIAASAAQRPGPASSAAGLFTVKSTAWSLGPGGLQRLRGHVRRGPEGDQRRVRGSDRVRGVHGTRRPTARRRRLAHGGRQCRPTRRERRTAPSTPSACAEADATCNAGSRSRSPPSRWGEGSMGARRREWGLPGLAPATSISAPGSPVLSAAARARLVARRRPHRRDGRAGADRGLGRLCARGGLGAGVGGLLRRPGARAGARRGRRFGSARRSTCSSSAGARRSPATAAAPRPPGRALRGDDARGARPPRVRPPRRREQGEPPWRAANWGPKRWASQAGVCARAAAGTASPTSNADYERHPGEAFAEVYRVLNERRSGSAALTWSIVDDSFIPDAAALRAAEEDVTRPWLAPVRTTVAGRFARGLQRRLIPVTTPLDGTADGGAATAARTARHAGAALGRRTGARARRSGPGHRPQALVHRLRAATAHTARHGTRPPVRTRSPSRGPRDADGA